MKWKCSVCGFIHEGKNPPKECPQCSSSSMDFSKLKKKNKLLYKGEKIDIMLINGSSHHGHNTKILIDIAEKYLKRKKIRYKRFDLNDLDVQHCWCCYSMGDNKCTYPCRNQLDDAPAMHEFLINAKAVIVASPINWNNMSARLKDFLDRLTCIQNRALLKKDMFTSGKILGILVNGHEDGAMKTAMDIFIYFQQMGYILAPYGFAYRLHGSSYNAKDDNKFFINDKGLKKDVEGVTKNIIETLKLDIEKKLNNKLDYVCE